MNECLCGCGRIPKSGNKFINGHNCRIRVTSDATREKLSIAGRGRTSPVKGMKLGPRPEEVKKKISEAQRGRPGRKKTAEEISKIIIGLTGRFVSEETKQKISNAHAGKIKHTPESKLKLSISHTGKKLSKKHRENIGLAHRGEKHWNWKGGRSAWRGEEWNGVRKEIRRRDGGICMVCGETKFGFMNFVPDVHHIIPFQDCQSNGIYPNNKENLICLCRSCHVKSDRNLEDSIPKLHAILSDRYGYTYP